MEYAGWTVNKGFWFGVGYLSDTLVGGWMGDNL
jgi:hypothetical protein